MQSLAVVPQTMTIKALLFLDLILTHIVEDLNVNYSPKITLYPLANGNSFQVKIKKAIFKKHPLKRGDIIKVVDSDHQYKMKKVEGEWVKSTTEKEWWINEYKVY